MLVRCCFSINSRPLFNASRERKIPVFTIPAISALNLYRVSKFALNFETARGRIQRNCLEENLLFLTSVLHVSVKFLIFQAQNCFVCVCQFITKFMDSLLKSIGFSQNIFKCFKAESFYINSLVRMKIVS